MTEENLEVTTEQHLERLFRMAEDIIDDFVVKEMLNNDALSALCFCIAKLFALMNISKEDKKRFLKSIEAFSNTLSEQIKNHGNASYYY